MTTVQDVFGNKEFPVREEYRDLFAQIMQAKDQHEGEALAQKLVTIIQACESQALVAGNFPEAENNQYSRNYIGRDPSGWESMICRWKTGAQSSVHGHPDFVFYYVLEGRIEMPFYELDADGNACHTRTQILEPGDWVYGAGESGRFDNMIHQVRALEPSLSLHVFSDDALKGEVFQIDERY